MFTSIIRFTLIAVLAVFITQCDGGSGGIIEVDTGSDTSGTDTGDTSSIDAEISVDPADTSSDGGTTDGGTTDGGTTDGGTTDGGTTDGGTTDGGTTSEEVQGPGEEPAVDTATEDSTSTDTTSTDTTSTDTTSTDTTTATEDTVDPRATDDDGDGYTEIDGDCNDADAAINPDAKEGYFSGNGGKDNADSKDNDCDHKIDETYCSCALLVGYASPKGTTAEEENIEEVSVEGTDTAIATDTAATSDTSVSSDTTTSSSTATGTGKRGKGGKGTLSGARGNRRSKLKDAPKVVKQAIHTLRTAACTKMLEELKKSEYFDCVEKPDNTGTDTTTTGSDTSGTTGADTGTIDGSGTTGADTGTIDGSGTTGADTGTTDGSGTTGADTGTTDGSGTTGADTGTTDGSGTTGSDTGADTGSGKDGEDSTASADTSVIDSYYVAWRGFWLDFTREQVQNMGNYLSSNTGALGSDNKAKATGNAYFETGGDPDVGFDWMSKYSAVAYDSTVMKVTTGNIPVTVYNEDADGSEKVYVWQGGSGPFDAWYNNADLDTEATTERYEYYVAVRGFNADCDYGQRLNDFSVTAYIDNGSAANKYEPADNSNHHLYSDPGQASAHQPYVNVVAKVHMNQAGDLTVKKDTDMDIQGECKVTVYYDVIGIDTQVMGATWFGSHDSGGGKSESDAYVDNVTLSFAVPSSEQIFPIIFKAGYDASLDEWDEGGHVTDAIRPAEFDLSVSVSDVGTNDSSAKGNMWGFYYWSENDKQNGKIAANETSGYLIYAKDKEYLVAKTSNTGSQKESGTDKNTGDNHGSASISVTLDVPAEKTSTTSSSSSKDGEDSDTSTSTSKDGEDSDTSTSTSTSTTGGRTFSPTLPGGGLQITR